MIRVNKDGSITVGILNEITPRDVKPEAKAEGITSPDVKKPAKKTTRKTVKK